MEIQMVHIFHSVQTKKSIASERQISAKGVYLGFWTKLRQVTLFIAVETPHMW